MIGSIALSVLKNNWQIIGIALFVALVFFRMESLKASVQDRDAKILRLEEKIIEADARLLAMSASIAAIEKTTQRRTRSATNLNKSIAKVEDAQNSIDNIESLSPAIGSALDILRARSKGDLHQANNSEPAQ